MDEKKSYTHSMLSEMTRIVVYSSLFVSAVAVVIAMWKGTPPDKIPTYLSPFLSVGAPILSAYLAVRKVNGGPPTVPPAVS